MAKGEIEVAFWGTTPPPEPFIATELFRETQVGAVGVRHPLAATARSGNISLEDYMSSLHWRVNYAASIPTLIDTTLDVMGLTRRIALETTSFGGNTVLLNAGSLILTLPSRVFDDPLGEEVILFPLPFAVPDFIYYLVWHPRTKSDPGSKWLRSQVIEAVQRGQSG